MSSISSKNEGKQVDLRFHSSKVEFFRSIFGGKRRHQKPFRNYLAFIKTKQCCAFENKKFVDITQQCFALFPPVTFPANNLNLDQIQAIFLNLFFSTLLTTLIFNSTLILWLSTLTSVTSIHEYATNSIVKCEGA